MHPILFFLGPIPVPAYGVMAAITLVIAMLVVRYYARLEGRDPQKTMDAMFWSVVAGFVGARVLEVIVNWERYFGQPGGLRLLMYSTGVFLGGLIAALVTGGILFRRMGLPVLLALDLLGPVAAIAEGFGRWGCFLSGCCWGTPSSLPWAVTFPPLARKLHAGLPDVPLHPTQVYTALVGLTLLGVLAWYYPRKRFHGQVAVLFVGLYSIARFFLEFVRGDAERGFVLGGLLSTSQLICLGLLVVAVLGHVALDRRHRASGEPDWKPARNAAPAPPMARKARSR